MVVVVAVLLWFANALLQLQLVPILLLLCLSSLSVTLVESSVPRIYTWTPHRDSITTTRTKRFEPDGVSWVSKSAMRCIVECSSSSPSNKYNNKRCDAVRFDKASFSCERGSITQYNTISLAALPPPPPGVSLAGFSGYAAAGGAATTALARSSATVYRRDVQGCDATLGYSSYENGGASFGCFRLSSSKADFDTSESDCRRSPGGRLLTITSMTKLDLVKLLGDGGDPFFIGLRKKVTDTDYRWSDGTAFTKTSAMWMRLWASEQPTITSSASCPVLIPTVALYDALCASKYNYVCEMITPPLMV